MPPRIVLKVVKGLPQPKDFSYERHDLFVFGRSRECTCSIPDDPYLSKVHFIIEFNPPDAALQDLGSKNGTYVNGVRTSAKKTAGTYKEVLEKAPRVTLKHDDVIKAGGAEMHLAIEQKGSSAAAVKPAAPAKQPSLSNITILKEIGSGGMGKVYLARLTDGREAVVKTMSLHGAVEEKKQLQYFEREMRSTMELKHPNIVAFYGSGRFEGGLYFAMEYCDSGSFTTLMESCGGRVPLEQAAPLMLQVADALEYAHARDIVHRDLKPGNILLKKEGRGLTAKISDFGLAKNYKLAGLSGVTEVGTAAGTLAFAPKEQLLNFRFTNPATDVFSTGAAFYSLLTGSYAYAFESVKEPLEAILDSRMVPLRKRSPDLPQALCAVIDKAVSPEAASRYQNGAELRAALKEVLK
ncbi:MAG: FHA domain-containing serine/threonine-protein kinase [Elusimicrobiota bacterium]